MNNLIQRIKLLLDVAKRILFNGERLYSLEEYKQMERLVYCIKDKDSETDNNDKIIIQKVNNPKLGETYFQEVFYAIATRQYIPLNNVCYEKIDKR
jgi:hypothetical protein